MLSGGVDPRLAGMCSQQRPDHHGASARLPLFGAARNGELELRLHCYVSMVVPVPVQTALIPFLFRFYFRLHPE